MQAMRPLTMDVHVYGLLLVTIAYLPVLVTSQVTDCFDESVTWTTCLAPNSSSQIPCSGRGECVCGQCECFPRRKFSSQKYSGRYCQCDDFSCDFFNNKICSGNGRCNCGVCDCYNQFQGNACQCPLSADGCRASNGKICNGMGKCECGVCRCDAHSSYRGPTCEECPTCPGKGCAGNKDCVLCTAFHTGSYDKESCHRNCQHVRLVHTLDTYRGQSCQFRDNEDGCMFYFTYEITSSGEYKVDVQTTKVCPPPDNSVGSPDNNAATAGHSNLGTMFGAIGALVLYRVPR